MALSFKRGVYLTHRWLGIGLCLLLVLWFGSGIVMMYVGYPKLTEAERLAGLPPLAAEPALLAPAEAWQRAGLAPDAHSLQLARARGGAPVYQARSADGRWQVVDAHTGVLLPAADEAVALASARAFVGPGVPLQLAGSVQEDAHTHSRALDPYRPLWRVDADDAAGTRLYVASTTGAVVRDATRTERGWNYVGTWLHWLYVLRGTWFDPYWTNTINVLSLVALGLALTGTVVGIWRWRFRTPYRSGSRSPYPSRWMRWHHVLGLAFALVTFTWLFSGLMSMKPWGMLRSTAPPLALTAMQGPTLTVGELHHSPSALLVDNPEVRELQWARRLGQPVVLVQSGAGESQLRDASTGAVVTLDLAAVKAAATRLVAAPVQRIEQLDAHDLYYYERATHTMTGGRERPLPVLRLIFDDAAATWVHVDPATGAVLGHLDRTGRWSRWLFTLLHSWDWLPLLERRPLWDAVLLLLSAGGLGLSVSGVVVGWRRLRGKVGAGAAAKPAPRRVRAR